jgi:hypothetical protein
LLLSENLRPEHILKRNGHCAGGFAAADDGRTALGGGGWPPPDDGDAANTLQVDCFIVDDEALPVAMNMLWNNVRGQNGFDARAPDTFGISAELC